ncbi:glycoside hydrolase family 97 protein [Neotamlana sedimentorum]|uniref:glycoside hydrolase family 97 protein n=1 Tax=Neotamlana sedimentorum TaxID=1435349 RepID=UPI000ADCD480|nr:glycoside hydrolase family 97 protein [Tamlana sedimentorum]
MKKILFSLMFVIALVSCKQSELLEITAPNGELKVVFNNENNQLKYNLFEGSKNIILNSEISLFQNVNVEVTNVTIKEVNNTWNPVWGQFSEIQNHYNELEVSLNYQGTPATLFARVYNKGIAFRFKTANNSTANNPVLFMEYNMPETSGVYSPAGEGQPYGPIAISKLGDPKENGKKNKIKMPLVIEHPTHKYLSLLESDLISAPGFDVIKFNLDKQTNTLVSKNNFNADGSQITTPWRIILVEDKVGDLLTNTIPLNVAEPNKLDDTSWIKPGKTLWDWRVHGFTAKDGFTYGIDNESYFRFIDFAAKNGIEYFLIDDAWYTKVEPGKMNMSNKLDLEKVANYAQEKGVELILYYDRRQGNYGDEALFPYYQSLGMKGIKYGFMGTDVPFTKNAIEMSAKSNLLIDFHDGPVPFTGVTRTYPNAITREFCHAQQDSRRAFTPKTFIRMALINALQGPLDMNNGIFDISSVNAGEREKGPKKLNSLQTTAVAEAARTLIIFSGLVCIPDAPEAYTEKQDLFEFIKEMPVGKWDETKILHAKMDGYISTARRQGDAWFIGTVHNNGGTLDIDFDFLDENKNYKITYYEDTKETNSKTNPEAYQIRTETIKKGDTIKVTMVAGGGHCMWIRPELN